MVSYLGSLVQFSPAAGRAGLCRQIPLCVGSSRRLPATLGLPRTGVSVLSPSTLLSFRLLYMERALRCVRFQFSGPPQRRGFGCACVLCLPRPQRFRQPEAWAHFPRMRRAFSLYGPSLRRRLGDCGLVRSQELASHHDPPKWRMSTIQNLRNSLDRNQRPVCCVGGGGFSGAEFAPFP